MAALLHGCAHAKPAGRLFGCASPLWAMQVNGQWACDARKRLDRSQALAPTPRAKSRWMSPHQFTQYSGQILQIKAVTCPYWAVIGSLIAHEQGASSMVRALGACTKAGLGVLASQIFICDKINNGYDSTESMQHRLDSSSNGPARAGQAPNERVRRLGSALSHHAPGHCLGAFC